MKKALIILMSITILGCSTARVTSNKAADFNQKIEKIYITVKGSENAKSFFNTFIKDFSDNLSQRGIPSQKHYFDPLSLESEKDIENKIIDFNPNLLMVINQTESRTTVNANNWGFNSYGSNTGGTFDVKIFEWGKENPVWRASLKADSGFQLSEAARKASLRLIEKLIEDGLL